MVQAYLELLKSWKDVRGRMRRDKFWEAFTCNVFIVVLLVMFTMRIGGVNRDDSSVCNRSYSQAA